MKKILFVINTMGCAGAEKALLKLLKIFPQEEYQLSLYILLGQGELIYQVPDEVNILNREYSHESVLSREGQKTLRKRVFRQLFSHGSVFRNLPYLMKNICRMVIHGKLSVQKVLWKVMADGGQENNQSYDLAVAYLEGGATYYVADHIHAKRKAAFVHVDYEQAGYGRSLDGGAYEQFQKIFVVSEEVKKSFLRVYPEYREKTQVFENIIDREEIIQKSRLPGGFEDDFSGIRILTVGRLNPQKAYDISIQAMKLLKDQGVNARWYVLGEGPLRGELERLVKKLRLEKDFLFLGGKENPYPYFAQADIYVHATRFEGKSIAIREAQVLGCPILVSDCSGNREQVQEDVDGAFCQLTPQDICRGIRMLIDDKEKARRYGNMAKKKSALEKIDGDQLFALMNDN